MRRGGGGLFGERGSEEREGEGEGEVFAEELLAELFDGAADALFGGFFGGVESEGDFGDGLVAKVAEKNGGVVDGR